MYDKSLCDISRVNIRCRQANVSFNKTSNRLRLKFKNVKELRPQKVRGSMYLIDV